MTEHQQEHEECVHTEETSEESNDSETRITKKFNWDGLLEYVSHVGQQEKVVKKEDYFLWTSIHMGLAFMTAGLYFLGYIGYKAYKVYKGFEVSEHPKYVYFEHKVVEQEEARRISEEEAERKNSAGMKD